MLAALLTTCHVDKLIKPSTADVQLSLAADTVGIADTIRLVAVAMVDGKRNPALRVDWSTDAAGFATVDTFGLVRGVARGVATITARVENPLVLPAPLTATAAVRVVVPRLLLAPGDTSFPSVGDTICLRATPLDAAGATLVGLTPAYAITVDPDSTVAAAGPAGCFRARRSGSMASVRAVLDTAQSTATLLVRPVAVTVTATPDSVRFNSLTAQRQLAAAAVDRRGNPIVSPTIIWRSRDTAVAAVDASSGVVTALRNGATWVLAESDTTRDSIRVAIAQVAAEVTVDPDTVTLLTVRGRDTLRATVRDSLNQPIGAAAPVWTSLAPDSVRVVTYGGASAVVEAVAEGSATIAAQDTVGDNVLTGTARITVRYELVSLEVAPPAATLLTIGDTVRFTATGRDANDSVVPQPGVVWRAADTMRVRIDSLTGLATARNAGATSVIARRDAVADTAAANVTPPVLVVNDASVFSDSALRSSTDTVSTTRVISNGGAGTLGVRLAVVGGASWLRVEPETVTVAAGGQISIRLKAAAGTLVEGTYSDIVRLQSVGAAGAPRDIPVSFRVYCPLDAIAPDTALAASLAATDCGARHQAGSFADYYTFDRPAGDTIRVAMTTGAQTSLDTYLYLLDGTGTVVASNDNCPGVGLNSCLQFAVPASGQYTIEATSFTAGAAFGYTLALTRPLPPAAVTALEQRAEGMPLDPGDSANTSTIEFVATAQDANPRDTLRFQVEVRSLAQAFDGTPTVTGASTPNAAGGVTLSATVSSLVNSTDYHWRARALDQTGRAGPWTAFGAGPGADFTVFITTPVLTVAPTSITDSALAGSTALRPTTVQITNTGNGTFTWSAATDSAWVGLSPGSGTPGAPLTISLNPTGKPAGTYQASVTVTAPGTVGSPVTIAVTFVIQQPVLVVTPTSVAYSTNAGSGAVFFDTLRIANGGTGPLAWTATKDSAWLSLDQTAGGAPDQIPLTINSAGRAAGTYIDTVFVTASGASGSPAKIPVTLTVHQPILAVTPALVQDSANVGSSVDRTFTLGITNADGGTLTWSAAKTAAWVRLSKTTGGVPDSIIVTLEPDTLSGVVHKDTIVFTSPEANNDPVKVPVVFDILQPTLAVTPRTIVDSAVQLQTTPRVHTLTVDNTGRGTLAWSAAADAGWIGVDPKSSGAPGALTVTLNPSGLVVGTHTGRVVVTAPNATGSPDTIPVTFKITPPPVLSLSPTSYSDSAFQGSALARSFALRITNTGPGALSWTAASGSPWITLSKPSGGAPPQDSTVVTLTPGSLAAGTHTGSVTVTAPGAAGSPATVPVSLKINPCIEPPVTPDTVIAGVVTRSDCGAPQRSGSLAKLYSMQAAVGDTLSFGLTAGFDAYLVLTDSFGVSLRQNDDCPGQTGPACIRDYGVQTAGRYVVEATTKTPGDTGAFTLAVVRERAPSAPQTIGQFRGDSVTAIGSVGATIPENAAVFKGTINDPNRRDAVRFEVELEPVGTPFSNTPTHQSALVPIQAGPVTVAVRADTLGDDTGFHWQARTCDQTGRCSGWLAFGMNAETQADFRVAVPENPGAPTQLKQFHGGSEIPVGGGTGGLLGSTETVTFRAVVTDPDPGDLISIEVEAKQTDAAFNGTNLARGSGVVSNGTASVSDNFAGPLLGQYAYYWRARACDQTGRCSGWASFGGNSDNPPRGTDFHVP